MVFSNLIFLGLFLPVVLIIYFGVSHFTGNLRWMNAVLLVASLFFYAWGEPVWVVAMMFTAAVDFTNGLLIEKYRGTVKAKMALIASLVINLGILFLFKYLGFAIGTVNSILGTELPLVSFAMPIGISFYTFQSLSYVIDLYWEKTAVQRNFGNQLLYVSMFPQLVAGPIVRYVDVEEQLRTRTVTLDGFSYGIIRFAIGLGKKVILANSAGSAATVLLGGDLESLPILSAWLGIIAYTFQIYFDFAGYSDMAIGLGRMFGFRYNENFNYPYISKSVTEFWRRWHISLGTFFRDYVYIPLGGNRKMQIRNLFVVWFLTGFWHGASWNFILWGLYYGVLLMVEKLLLKDRLSKRKVIGNVYTMLLVIYGWGIFYFTDMSRLMQFSSSFFGLNGQAPWMDMKTVSVFCDYFWMLLLLIVASTPYPKQLFQKAVQRWPHVEWLQLVGIMGVFAISFILLVGQSYNPFLYFRF